MLDEKRQERYDSTMKHLRFLNSFSVNKIEPFDDKAAVVVLAEDVEYYKNRIQQHEEEIRKLKADRKALKKTVIKLVAKMLGEE